MLAAVQRMSILGNPIDLGKLIRAEPPRDCPDVLLDLLDAGGPRNHARHLRPRRKPGEGEFDHGVSARLRKRLEPVGHVLVARRDVAVAQRRRRGKARIRAAVPRWYFPVRRPLASGKNGNSPSLYS